MSEFVRYGDALCKSCDMGVIFTLQVFPHALPSFIIWVFLHLRWLCEVSVLQSAILTVTTIFKVKNCIEKVYLPLSLTHTHELMFLSSVPVHTLLRGAMQSRHCSLGRIY